MSRTKRNYVIFSLSRFYGETKCSWKASYYTRSGLISRLALNESYRGDHILDNLSVDMSETTLKYKITNDKYFGTRVVDIPIYYIVKLEGNAVKRITKEDVIKEVTEEKERILERRAKAHERYLAKQRIEKYEFRRDPVPGVHKRKYHIGCYYRHPLTRRSIAESIYVDEDYTFIDTKAKILPTTWDDLARHKDKSWKTSYKVRKPWMKNAKKHKDTVKFNKKDLSHFYYDEE